MNLFTDLTQLFLVIGLLAFMVSVITEVTKQIKWFDKIPTAFEVMVLSLILSPLTLLGLASYYNIMLEWYMVAGSFVIAFVVALIAMDGWERVTELFSRFVKK